MYIDTYFTSLVDFPGNSMPLIGSFRPDLVALSIAIAIFGGWAGMMCLARAEKLTENNKGSGSLWKVAGGLAFGGAIWGMHFIGMLAFSLPCGISYDFLTTSISIVPAILASLTALFVVSQQRYNLHLRLIIGAVLMGAGIGTMHYVGMAAMRLPAILFYDPQYVALSVFAAIILSYISLAVVEYGQRQTSYPRARQIIAAITLGLAVASMHYIAMQAAIFYPILEDIGPTGRLADVVLAVFVGLGTLVLAGGVATAAFAARLKESVRNLADEARQRAIAEKDARADQARLQAIFDTAVEAIIVIDKHGTIRQWSESGYRIFGYTAQEALGQNIAMITNGISPNEHRQYIRNYEDTHEARVIGIGREVSGLHKDGTIIPLELSVGETKIDGDILYTGILRDISVRKEIERELREATRAKEANEMKSNFLAHMSHEMRTPLNAILGFSDIMRAQAFGPINETYVGYSEDIFSSGNHLLSIVDALLELSKIEQDSQNLELTDIALPILISDAVNTVQNHAEEKKLTVAVLLDNDLPETMNTDRGKLYQVLINLIKNAVQYTPAEGRVTIRAWPCNQQIQIVIEDNGIGMTEEEVEFATKPFGQVKNAFTSDLSGTGLGLPIVHAFVDLLRGEWTISSQKGEGTKIKILFPLSLEKELTEGQAAVG
ncbi:MHYT domain-containing protein [Kiloniella litopenaei]|uniref:sensor histidine kinase n=1 Tax=Kiloniella litopenaei TaxID=1549748 RepID=UPI003BAAE64F